MTHTPKETDITVKARAVIRWALAALYGVAGLAHFTATDRFLLIVPSWVPEPRFVVQVTGVCEIAGAAALLIPKLRRAAGLMLALYALFVLPANVKHAVEGVSIPGLPDSWWYHGPRLAFQPVLIWLALYGSHVVDWPFRARPKREPMRVVAPSTTDGVAGSTKSRNGGKGPSPDSGRDHHPISNVTHSANVHRNS